MIAREIAGLLRDAAGHVWHHRIGYGVAWLVTLFVSVLLYRYDAVVLARVQAIGDGAWDVAKVLTDTGRFESSSLAFAVILAVAAWALRSNRLRRAAVACLLAGVVAGIAVSLARPALGRARPNSDLEPGFYWLEMRAELGSMPSGHAATNSASAVAIAVTFPPLAPAVLAYAGGVGWSRMQLNVHYPTDILWGTMLGASVGLAIGVATRDRRRTDASRVFPRR